jgi:nicotinamide-nucleotide amidase
MKAEILCVGTELIIGQTVNSNATWLSKRLAALGIDVLRHVAVGDNRGRIAEAMQQAWDWADLIVMTGGLGPTDDDLTHDAIAAHFQLPLVEDPEALRSVTDAFARWGKPVRPTSLKMASIPEGGAALYNTTGSAPGIWLERDGRIIVTMPGVPREMAAMWETAIEPRLTARSEGTIRSRLLKFVGIAESEAAAMIRDRMDAANPSVAPYVGNGELYLRVTAKAATPDEAEALIQPVVDDILAVLGRWHFGQDEETLEGLVIQGLIDRGETVAVAESVTGGWLAQRLTAVPGASQAFAYGAVTYTNATKAMALGIDRAFIEAKGAVSAETAQAMADGVRRVAGTTWGLAITGLAGPQGDGHGLPVGRVYVAISGPDVRHVDERDFGAVGRDPVRWMSTQVALRRLQQALGGRVFD